MRAVSIPRSGFCSFRLGRKGRFQALNPSFNPSFGILLIQTLKRHLVLLDKYWFQSLVRDSAHSDWPVSSGALGTATEFQSLVRDSAHSDQTCLSMPHHIAIQRSFNPSFGILLIQTSHGAEYHCASRWFQSLVRDSAHSDYRQSTESRTTSAVSIPRSGFCSFRPSRYDPWYGKSGVSIPRSGFCSFRLDG